MYQAVAAGVNLVNLGLLFRFLEEEVVGLWFLMVAGQAFLGLFDLGFGQTLQRRLAFAKASGGADPAVPPTEEAKRRIRGLFAVARRFYTLAGLAVFLLTALAGSLYFRGLDLSPEIREQLKWSWPLMALGYGAGAWGFFVQAGLNGLGSIGWLNVVNTAVQLGVVIANFAVLSQGWGLPGLAAVWLAKGVASRLAGWQLLKRRHAWLTAERTWQPVSIADLIAPSLRWWAALLGSFWITGITPFLIAAFLGPAAVPDYVASYTVMAAAQGALVGMVSVGTPLYSQMIRAGDTAQVRAAITPLSRYGLGALGLVYCWFVLHGERLFELWLGPGHYVGDALIVVFMVMLLAEAHQGMLQCACVAAERLSFYKYVLAGGVIATSLSLGLIPRLGILGAALAQLLGQALTQNWATPLLALRTLGCSLRYDLRLIVAPTIAAIALVLFVGVPIAKCRPLTPATFLVNVATTVAAGVLLVPASTLRRVVRRGY